MEWTVRFFDVNWKHFFPISFNGNKAWTFEENIERVSIAMTLSRPQIWHAYNVFFCRSPQNLNRNHKTNWLESVMRVCVRQGAYDVQFSFLHKRSFGIANSALASIDSFHFPIIVVASSYHSPQADSVVQLQRISVCILYVIRFSVAQLTKLKSRLNCS